MVGEEPRLKGGWRDPVLAGVVALCLLVRLAVLCGLPADYQRLPRDVDLYGYFADRLAHGESYSLPGEDRPTAIRPPLYPLLLAPIYAVGLGETPVPLLLQAMLDAATCILLYLFARQLRGSRSAARLAALFWAVYLPEASMTTRLWTEPLAALLATAALWALAAAIQGRGGRWEVGAGVLLGLGALTRSTLLPLAGVVVVVMALVGQGGWGVRLRRAALILITCLITLSPWIARNAIAFGAFVPTTTHGGTTFYEGNCGLGDGDFLRNIHPEESNMRFSREMERRYGIVVDSLSEPERDRLFRAEASQLIRAHPGRYVLLSLQRFTRLWGNVGYGGETPSRQSLAVCALNGLLLLAFVIGLLLHVRSILPAAAPALALVAGATLLHMVIIAYIRYSFPLVPAVAAMTIILLRLNELLPCRLRSEGG